MNINKLILKNENKFFILFLLLFLLVPIPNVFAYDINRPNNKFGIHLAQPDLNDLKKAAQLVNSNGGDWGYVTLVLQDNDRDRNKWQEVFDRMRELRLIPIIRLATHPDGAVWPAPKKEQANEWANFLDSLNWVVKNRYVILFNEPNHAAEWGGAVDAKDYAKVAKEFAQKLKEKNPDFFVMLAGLDASSPNWLPQLADEQIFLKELLDSITAEEFNKLFSGWVSHSYPNPGFLASPYNSGRGSVRNYQWELDYLNQLGIKNLPVFITETGWDGSRLSKEAIASYFETAYENVWLPDSRVVAMTPFILNYQGEPFAKFSWAKVGNQDYYSQYFTVQGMTKKTGNPEIIDKGIMTFALPGELVSHSNYHFKISLKNGGQAIWDKDKGYQMKLEGIDDSLYLFSDIKNIKPFEKEEVDLFLKTNSLTKDKQVKIVLYKDKQKVTEGATWKFEIVPFPRLKFETHTYPKFKTMGEDFEIQVFDPQQQLVFKKGGLNVNNGIGMLDEIQNIALDQPYRLVILKSYYLPRQEHVKLHRGENLLRFKTMYPLDFNNDGKLDLSDLLVFIRNLHLVSLFIP